MQIQNISNSITGNPTLYKIFAFNRNQEVLANVCLQVILNTKVLASLNTRTNQYIHR